ncbi:MAG: phospholipid carrier-dependent glycosyltransferase [Phycisphaerales bacterium]
MSPGRLWIQVGLIFAVLYLALLWARPMITPDEARYGAMGADMLASGEWLKLRMCGFVYYEKPPLGTWLIAASIGAFGHNAFAVRLPCVLASLVSAVAAGMVARRISGRREAAPLAAMVQLSSIFPMVIGTVAVLDPIFTAFTSLTLAWFLEGATARAAARWRWLLAAGAAAGLAFMTKGLLAFAIPALAAGGWVLWDRRWRELPALALLPMVGAALVAGPLAWLLHRSEPDFWRYFVEVEHFRRFASPDDNQHGEPWWLLSLVLVGGGLFWSVVWTRAWGALRGDAGMRSGVRFCVAWVALPLALLSLSKGKLPTYVLPLFPPVSAMVALGLLRWREQRAMSRDAGTAVALTIVRLLAITCLTLAVVGGDRFGIPRLWIGAEWARWLLLATVFLAWSLLESRAHRAHDASAWLARMAWVPVPGLLCVHLLFPTALLSATKTPWGLLERHASHIRDASRVIVSNSMGHPVNWASGRTDLVIVGDPSEFDNELGIKAERTRFITHAELQVQVQSWLASGPVVITTGTGTIDALAKALPDRVLARETDRDVAILVLSPTR